MALTATASAVLVWVVLLASQAMRISGTNGPYASDLLQVESMRPAVVAGLVVFLALVAAFLAQCARVGGPARDRRLAAFRLAGATPADVRRVVTAEAFLSAGLGSATGAALAWTCGGWVDHATTGVGAYTVESPVDSTTVMTQSERGRVHLLPLDVHLPLWARLVVLVAVPLLVAVSSNTAQWRVLSGPFAVARRTSRRVPTTPPVLLFAVGLGGLVVASAARAALGVAADQSGIQSMVIGGFAILALLGLLLGTAPLAQRMGRRLARRTSSPAMLIAARRLDASPYTSARAHSVLLAVVAVFGFVLGVQEYLRVVMSPEDTGYRAIITVVLVVLGLAAAIAALGVLVSCGEAIVAGRSSLAALHASGVPRGVLRRALFIEAVLPLIVMTPVAGIAGVAAARGALGTSDSQSLGSVAHETIVVEQVPVPWADGIFLILGAWMLAGLVSWVGTALAKKATQPAELRGLV